MPQGLDDFAGADPGFYRDPPPGSFVGDPGFEMRSNQMPPFAGDPGFFRGQGSGRMGQLYGWNPYGAAGATGFGGMDDGMGAPNGMGGVTPYARGNLQPNAGMGQVDAQGNPVNQSWYPWGPGGGGGQPQPPRIGTISGMQAPPGYMDPMGQYNQWQQGQPWAGGGPKMGGYPGVIGAGGAGAMAGALAQQQNFGYAKANAANELRYRQILGGYGNAMAMAGGQLGNLLGGYAARYKTGLGNLDALQAAEQAQIKQRATQQVGDVKFQAINSGLGNTTVPLNLQNQVAKNADFSYGQLAGQMAGYKTQLQGQYSQDYLNAMGKGYQGMQDINQQRLAFMERRNDRPPPMGPFMQAMGGLGAGQQNYANAGDLYNQRNYGGYY